MFGKNKTELKTEVKEQPKNDGKIRKTNSNTRIVYDDVSKSFKVRKVTNHYVYNEIRRKWDREKVEKELLPLSTLNPEPKKTVVLDIIVAKPIVDPESMEMITGYFLRQYEYRVTEEYPSEFLVVKNGTVFRNNFAVKECSPLPVIEANKLHGIIVKQLGKDKKLTETEAMKLKNEGVKIYEKMGNSLRFQLYEGVK
jgi:sensor histidine kinase YesM